jgi:hypothetical protein
MKRELERLDYIVIAFIDLNAEDYLRAIRFFREICETAEHVSILVYVSGHGYQANHHDYLIPIDSRLILHRNGHKKHGINHIYSLNSLDNLLENFISDPLTYPKKKYTVVCLWDLCREEWNNVDIEATIDKRLNNSLDYTILYSWSVLKQG